MIYNELISGLNSPDAGIVAETIQELRLHGNVDVLPAVFDLLFSKIPHPHNDQIVNLLNDVKDPKAVPVFIDAVKTFRGSKVFDQLVSACWQCGLDFSPYIDVFIDLVIEEDYYTSLEAFSVIEENVSLLTTQQRSARLEYIRSRMENLSPEKRLLVNELMSMVSTISGPFRLDPDPN